MERKNYKSINFIDKLLHVARSTKVVKGGRVFSFSSLVALGNQRGVVGIGIGKSKEVSSSIQKGIYNAKKNLFYIELNNNTVFHKIEVSYCSSKVILLPARAGTGLRAGIVIRSFCDVLGIKDIRSKCIGSTNPKNVVHAMLRGLLLMRSKTIRFNKQYV